MRAGGGNREKGEGVEERKEEEGRTNMMHEVELSHGEESTGIPRQKLERRDDEVAKDGRNAENGNFGIPLREPTSK